MKIQVYRGGTPTILLNLEQGEYSYGKMEIRELAFSVESSDILDIQIGDTLTYLDEEMRLNYTPTYRNVGQSRRSYTLVFEAPEATLIDQPLEHEGDISFSYFGNASDLLKLLLSNINDLDDGWTAGEVDVVEPQSFEFNNIHCFNALTTIAEQFKLEWKVSQKVITLKKNIGVERLGILSQGRGKGLYDLTRNYLKDSNIVTRAYALGGTQNLPEGSENQRLKLDGYVEKNTEIYGVKKRYYTFEEVFPRRDGTATAVNKINDKSYSLTDTTLDFDINGQRAGENDVKIVFKSGALNGQEFVVTRYNHATKTITYKANEDNAGKLMPFSSMMAENGDSYTLIGLLMPQSYVDTALAELRAKCMEALDRDSIPKVVYSFNADVLFLKKNGLQLTAGDIIRVKDDDINLDELLTIQRVKYPAIFPDRLTPGMQFSATVGNTSYTRLNDKLVEDNKKQVIINAELRKQSAELARLNALNLRELRNYIFDADDYFDSNHIKPQSIETQMLAVGAKSQNFFLSGVTMQPNYQGDASTFYVSEGQLQHREITIPAGFIWNLNPQTFSGLDASKSYYLSARCSTSQLIGTFNLSGTPIKVEDEPGFFNFNIGVLYPVKDGKRFFANTAGVTYVVGNQITTGRLQSTSGRTWFDLDTGEIQGVLKFSSGQAVENAIANSQDLAINAAAQDASQKIDAIKIGDRNLLRNTTNFKTTQFWTGNGTVVEVAGEFDVNTVGRGTNSIRTTLPNGMYYSNPIKLKCNTEYVYQAYLYTNGVVVSSQRQPMHFWLGTTPNADNQSYSVISYQQTLPSDVWTKCWIIFKTGGTTGTFCYMRPYLYNSAGVGYIYASELMLSEGNKLPTYSSAPEDIEQRVSTAETSITQNANEIALKASRQYVDTSINDIQIGSTNNYSYVTTPVVGFNGVDNIIKASSLNGITVTGSPTYNGIIRMGLVITENGWWTVSGWVRSTQNVDVPFHISICDGSSSPVIRSNGNEWTYFTYSNQVYNYTPQVYHFVDFHDLGHLYYQFKDIKIEKGNKATDWSMSPQDVDSRLTSAEIKLQPDQINLVVKDQIQIAVGRAYKQISTVGLNPNESYPLVISLSGSGVRYRIQVTRPLSHGYGVPPYSTHGAGFSMDYIWTTNASGWGSQLVTRIMEKMDIMHVFDSRGWGGIHQNNEQSSEIIYLRGGSVYDVIVEGTSNPNVINLYTTGYWPANGQQFPVAFYESVVRPEITYQDKGAIQAGITITPNTVNVFGKAISMTGIVTFSSLDNNAKETIANDASTKANSAQVNAQNYTNTRFGALGSLAYDNLVEFAKLGSTVIQGGFLKSELINVTALFAQYIEAKNLKLTDSSQIGHWYLDVTGYGFTELRDHVHLQLGNYMFSHSFRQTVNGLTFSATRKFWDAHGTPTEYRAKLGTENYTDPFLYIKSPSVAIHVESGDIKVDDSIGIDTSFIASVWRPDARAWRSLVLTYKKGILVERRWE